MYFLHKINRANFSGDKKYSFIQFTPDNSNPR